ncbi:MULTISPECIES: acyl-CoA synthetase [unclassified Streptomyces]|uniref:acyl-CoA synthetase n=1 Tax=unclassified Streptomyces TaxID=2593676 RepID=UPI0023672CDF|nr:MULTISPECIES: acyl-CoA synthetase [unclassified Streptomyces]MDF3147795.1 acyl-CoA synthetase [Streptomyces sp. T21Q-yed]WDF37837.1 acyl-CoA synthetase [Streptomyces sp. T12]
MSSLFPALTGAPAERAALRFGDRSLTYGELGAASGALAARIGGAGRVAVWATPALETAVAVLAALEAGVAAVPLNPKSGEKELGHILSDCAPQVVLAAAGDELPAPLGDLTRIDVDVRARGPRPLPDPQVSDEDPALIVYTSGTTGPPKGAVIPRRAVTHTLDALADAWQWTGEDVLVHGLPLFHVHGLVLGILGPLRRGGSVRHLGRFSTEGVASELNEGATMVFGVPTMYHRIAQALPEDPGLAQALGKARLLVSGSAALPVHDHERITAATGQRVVERYGMTETLMNTSVRADGEPRAGTVGVPLPGVELRLVEEDGTPITVYDGETVGEIQVRGPNLFTEYLNRPDATTAAFTQDGWFRTGDMAVRDPDGYVRIVGRKATDLIKSGGYKIGAGEIENALLEHAGVREAAVTGEPDADLGERIVAWIVPADPQSPPPAEELANHVAARLAPHKRPRKVHYLDALPRNDMGKIMKRALTHD